MTLFIKIYTTLLFRTLKIDSKNTNYLVGSTRVEFNNLFATKSGQSGQSSLGVLPVGDNIEYTSYETHKRHSKQHVLLFEGVSLATYVIIRLNNNTISKIHSNGVGYKVSPLKETSFLSNINIQYSIFNKSIKSSLYYRGCKFSEVVYPFRGTFSNEQISVYIDLMCSGNGEFRVSQLISLARNERDEKLLSEDFDYSNSKTLFTTLPQVTYPIKILGLTKGSLEKVCSSLKALIAGFQTDLDIIDQLDYITCGAKPDFQLFKLKPNSVEYFRNVKLESSTVKSVAFGLVKRLSDSANRPSQVIICVTCLLLNLYWRQARYLLDIMKISDSTATKSKKSSKGTSKASSKKSSTPKEEEEEEP